MCLCEIGHSNVDEEALIACNEKMPEHVTFQATLSGTSDYDSAYLLTSNEMGKLVQAFLSMD